MLYGMLLGITLGVSLGYMVAITSGIRVISSWDEGQVVLGLGTLYRLGTNDVAKARNLNARVVACNYAQHVNKSDGWLFRKVRQNPDLVRRVEKARKDLPELDQAIAEMEKESTNKPSEATP